MSPGSPITLDVVLVCVVGVVEDNYIASLRCAEFIGQFIDDELPS